MNKILQNSLFYVVVFCVTYFIYVYPFEILNELIFDEIAEFLFIILSYHFNYLLFPILFFFKATSYIYL